MKKILRSASVQANIQSMVNRKCFLRRCSTWKYVNSSLLYHRCVKRTSDWQLVSSELFKKLFIPYGLPPPTH